MNRDETKKILAVLQGAYPQFYRGVPDDDLKRIINLWTEMFADEPVEMVAAAVKAMIASRVNTFPPNIGEVKAQIVKMRMPDETTAAEAWLVVANAIRNGVYGAQEEFKRLPPLMQRLVGSPQQLREWAAMDVDTVASVIASNFQRSYTAAVKTEREKMMIPSDIRKMISDAGCKKAIVDGRNGMTESEEIPRLFGG